MRSLKSDGSVLAEGTPVSPVCDAAPPQGGMLSYLNGENTEGSDSIAIDLNPGTDDVSGLLRATLQRSQAALLGNVCQAFGNWVNIGDFTAITTYADKVSRETCNKYQLLVFDRVGNKALFPSSSVVKVPPPPVTVAMTFRNKSKKKVNLGWYLESAGTVSGPFYKRYQTSTTIAPGGSLGPINVTVPAGQLYWTSSGRIVSPKWAFKCSATYDRTSTPIAVFTTLGSDAKTCSVAFRDPLILQ